MDLFSHTTRKKALEVMQKGVVIYRLSSSGKWQVAEHFGDGFDLLAINKEKTVRIELKAIDLKEISTSSKSFTQSISPNEIVNATHLVISVFDQVDLRGNYIMTMEDLYHLHRHTKKFAGYESFIDYKNACRSLVNEKSISQKISNKTLTRLNMDINCSIDNFNNGRWKIQPYKDLWDNLNR